MNNRIQAVIKAVGLKKIEFAKRIRLSAPYISELCSGKTCPSDRTISDICREFHISETWLRTGEGEMFTHAPEAAADRLAKEYGLDDLGRQIMAAYLKLDESDRLSVGRLIQNIIDERPAPAPAPEPGVPAGKIVPPGYSSREELEQEADEFAAMAREQFLSEKKRELSALSAKESGAG